VHSMRETMANIDKKFWESQWQSHEFDRLDVENKLFTHPPIKFKDLDAYISEHKVITGPIFPFDVRTDVVKVTNGMDMVPITIQLNNRDMTFVTKDGISYGRVNIFGKVTTIIHRIVQQFEDTVEVKEPSELLTKTLDHKSLYWKSLPLQPGEYRLDIAIKDVNNSDHIGIYARSITVPSFEDKKISASSLILADQMDPVSSREISAGSFVLGNLHIRPKVASDLQKTVVFKRNQEFNFWMQFYNLGIDEKTKSNSAIVSYQIVDESSHATVFEKKIDSNEIDTHSDQLTIQKTLYIGGLQPSKYLIQVNIDDQILKQQLTKTAQFIVE
jgi:hypothetical protein